MSQLENSKDIETESLEEKERNDSEQHDNENSEAEGSEETSPLHNSHVQALIKELEQYPHPEAKLQKAISFMEEAISQSKTPHFKSFWQVRDLCLELFKENISPPLRVSLWAKYSELSKEARRLKDLLDEQSAFAVEQIEIAINALENDLEKKPESQESQSLAALECKTLEAHSDSYSQIQNELNFLNVQAVRVNALRKELIKTEMRIRKKNKFFQRLSAIGDKIFPRRKELIQGISKQFMEDVEMFINIHFSHEKPRAPYFFLRDEIKALQGAAKSLTLNSGAFARTRIRLSECWDKIKVLDKERKQELANRKATFKQNVDTVLKNIEEVKQAISSDQLSTADGNQRLDNISASMRDLELGRDEVKFLRDQIAEARKPLLEKMRQIEEERQEHVRERIRQKQKLIADLQHEIDALLKAAPAYSLEQLSSDQSALLGKIQESALIKTEKQELERQLKPLNDLIADKKEQALMALSADDRQSLEQLREVLRQRRERRQEIKEKLEDLRRACGASGLDFERAMEYQSQIGDEKDRLEKINHGLIEIEEKIVQLEQKQF